MKYNHELQSIGYPEEIKKAIVAHHYENNVSYGNLSILIYGTKSGQSTFRTWDRKYGSNEVTAARRAKSVRFDVQSIAKIVKQIVEDGVPYKVIANTHSLHKSTVYAWTNKYGESYKQYLDLPEGVMQVVKEDQLIYGANNIAAAREELTRVRDAAQTLLNTELSSGTMRVSLEKLRDTSADKITGLADMEQMASTLGYEISLNIKGK